MAGEIGARISKLAIFSHKKDSMGDKIKLDSLLVSQTFITQEYAQRMPDMIEVFIDEYYDGKEEIYGACFGIAGLIENGRTTIDTQDFQAIFTEQEFRQKLPYKNVPISFINDMEAIGYGIFLGDGEEQLQELYPGKAEFKSAPNDNRVLMLVSEGLGQALWYWDEKKEKLSPISSEGGNANFSPRTRNEIELLLHLKNNELDKPISYQYILSSQGLVRIYEFFQSKRGEKEQNINDATSIIEQAVQGNPLCQDSLEMFISIWGAKAGDLALEYKAKGGIFIGGISIPIEILKQGTFINAFIDKQKDFFKEFNKRISIKVFEEKDIVLLGAARYSIDAGFVTKGKFAIMRSNQ